MPFDFEPISFSRQDDYYRRLELLPQEASDYSFVNLWAWADEYGIEWAWEDDLVWIRQQTPEPCYWAPVGDWKRIDWAKCLKQFPVGSLFIRVPEELTRLWKMALAERISVSEAREHWDYLYSVRELIQLKGNKFHKKKNLLNQFLSKYRFEYQPVTPDLVGKVLLMQLDWCAWRNCEASAGLAAEDRVIKKTFGAYERFSNMSGGALMIDHQVIAFTVGEAFNDDTLVIHFEKGLDSFKGVYQAINKMFLEENAHFKTVNREQDLGNKGLRKAKLSYNPSGFLKKQKVLYLG